MQKTYCQHCPPGRVRINLSQQLDGQVEGFGSRFWALIAQQHAGWKKVLLMDAKLLTSIIVIVISIAHFTVRLLGEILTELVEQGLAERAELTVSVKSWEYSSRQHDSLYNAWLDEQDRQQVMTTLLEEGYLGPAWSGKSHG